MSAKDESSGKWEKREGRRNSIKIVHEKHAERKLELERRRDQMRAEQRMNELAHLEQEIEFKELKMMSEIELLNVLKEEADFNRFRFECHEVVVQFDKFLKMFNKNGQYMKRLFDKMKKDRVRIKEPVLLTDVVNLLVLVVDSLQNLTIITHAHLKLDFNQTQGTVLGKCWEVENAIKEVISSVQEHRDDFKTMMARKISTRKEYLKRLDDIETLFEDAKRMVYELNVLIQQFEIPPTTRFEETARRQLAILSSEAPQLTDEPGETYSLAVEDDQETSDSDERVKSVMSQLTRILFAGMMEQVDNDLLYKLQYFLDSDEKSNQDTNSEAVSEENLDFEVEEDDNEYSD